MKKEISYKFLYGISILLIFIFIIILGVDYFKYDTHSNSSPFYAFIIVRMIEFIIPSIIVFVMGKIMKKNMKSRQG
ncbi:MAG TPA: hypothetical protein DCZ30_07365 [Clostridiales bacterium]|nr:hypothetical protein [Clostridiales bacterium]